MINELKALSAERVWKEFEKALTTENPNEFIETLRMLHLDEIHFPIDTININENDFKWFKSNEMQFALLFNGADKWQVNDMLNDLKAPNSFQKFYNKFCTHSDILENWKTIDTLKLAQTIYSFRTDYISIIQLLQLNTLEVTEKETLNELVDFVIHTKLPDEFKNLGIRSKLKLIELIEHKIIKFKKEL